MRSAILTRTLTGDEGTFGSIAFDSGLTMRTGELPWRKNEPDFSCIPKGTYNVIWMNSPRWVKCYHVVGVAGRSNIEIHPANFMGDSLKKLRCDLKGCIAFGTSIGPMNGQTAILFSRQVFVEFNRDLKEKPFKITIVESY